jgi:hypothetical protein
MPFLWEVLLRNMPLTINIRTIPHEEQRFGCIGDWFFTTGDDGDEILEIRTSAIGDWRMEFLVARHELDEAMLCKAAGISTKMVDDDEKNAQPDADPDSFSGYGDDWLQFQHNDALAAEWVMARLLGIDWKIYGARCAEAGWDPKQHELNKLDKQATKQDMQDTKQERERQQHGPHGKHSRHG